MRFRVFLLAVLSAACADSPSAPRLPFFFIRGSTGHVDSVSVDLTRYNSSWVPREGAIPPADTVLATVLLTIENRSDRPRTLGIEDFRLRAYESASVDFSVWTPSRDGRAPGLDRVTLGTGRSAQGWLTYRLPFGFFPDAILWSAGNGFVLAIPFSGGDPYQRVERGLVFGRVSDAGGEPVVGATVEVTHVSDDFGTPGTFGACPGHPGATFRGSTDPAGRYEIPIGAFFGYGVCIDVRVLPPPASGWAEARAGGRRMHLSTPDPDAEPPEMRVDVVLVPSS